MEYCGCVNSFFWVLVVELLCRYYGDGFNWGGKKMVVLLDFILF